MYVSVCISDPQQDCPYFRKQLLVGLQSAHTSAWPTTNLGSYNPLRVSNSIKHLNSLKALCVRLQFYYKGWQPMGADRGFLLFVGSCLAHHPPFTHPHSLAWNLHWIWCPECRWGLMTRHGWLNHWPHGWAKSPAFLLGDTDLARVPTLESNDWSFWWPHPEAIQRPRRTHLISITDIPPSKEISGFSSYLFFYWKILYLL